MTTDKRVERNMLLNMLKTLTSIVFPLITYPYVTRVLQVENYGRVNFGMSVIGYIALIASLGISSYAIRESGLHRDDRIKLERFVSEVFTINILTTIVAFAILILLCFISPKLNAMFILLLIQSLSIWATTLGIDYVNVIYEDYIFITLRSIIIQFIALVLMFVFVKDPDDYYLYAFIQVNGSIVIAVTNWFHVRKYCHPRIVTKTNISKHIKPIIVLFSNSLAVSIYLNSDKLMLGWMVNEYWVGIYSVAVTIYSILKQLIAAIYSVTVTRLTEYINKDKKKDYCTLINSVLNDIVFISIPITIGLTCTSRQIILAMFGEMYTEAVVVLQVLAFAILFAVLGGAFAFCINLPNKREKKNLAATSLSAVVNIGLNIWMIPAFKATGAAITTMISEATVCIALGVPIVIQNKDLFDFGSIKLNFIKSLIASLPIILFTIIISHMVSNVILNLGIIVVCSAVSFFGISILLKNTTLIDLIKHK